MFLARYFKNGFHFKTLLSHSKENLFKVILYLIVLSIIVAFPLNYLTVVTDGSKINFIYEDFSSDVPIGLEFPEGMFIKNGKLHMPNDTKFEFTHKGITYLFNHKVNNFNDYKNHVLLETDYIIFAGNDTVYIPTDGYKGFTAEFSISQFNTASYEDKQLIFAEFGLKLEQSFSQYIVLYTVLRNTLITIVTNIIYVFLMSLLLQVFRFGYTKFYTLKEGFVFVVMAMGFPTLLSFIVGILLVGFGPVVFQLSMGILIMAIMIKYGKSYFSA